MPKLCLLRLAEDAPEPWLRKLLRLAAASGAELYALDRGRVKLVVGSRTIVKSGLRDLRFTDLDLSLIHI